MHLSSTSKLWLVPASLALIVSAGCADEVAIGQPCQPAVIPCDAKGENCGFQSSERYVDTGAAECEGQVCVVHKLDNGTKGQIPADPRVSCKTDASAPGCVSEAALEASMFCSCRCDRSDGKREGTCECGEGFQCTAFGPSLDSYCVRMPSE
jgi:hypothetical protein